MQGIYIPTILSIIIDIMDQAKCKLPRFGSQGVFSDPFDQLIVGVKVNFYMNFKPNQILNLYILNVDTWNRCEAVSVHRYSF